jgi:protoheme IX farnesyltransferase
MPKGVPRLLRQLVRSPRNDLGTKGKTMKKIRLYMQLTKPRIIAMVLVTASLGFYIAKGMIESWMLLLWTLLGTYLVGSGSSVINHYMERDIDAKMERTQNRPLPLGLISPESALIFGVNLLLIGLLILFLKVNVLTAFFALLGAFLYNLVYTPMKRLTWWNTFVGSIPGALPPLWGWTAASGELHPGAWILFAILLVWQHPHFFAIAWMYRKDYARADLKMLPVVEPDGESTFRQALLYSLILIPLSLAPVLCGIAGYWYFWGALFLGLAFFVTGVHFVRQKTVKSARVVLLASVIYLPLLFALIVGDSFV